MDVKDYLIDETLTIIDTMKRLDQVSNKTLFIIKNDRLIAAITDGDIRRWILKKGDLNAPIKLAANYQPKFLKEVNKALAKNYMKKESIDAVPIVNDDMFVKVILFLNEKQFISNTLINIPVVIMAGGLGTRLYPYTKILPKALIPIGEIPIVEHIINRFNQYGNDHVYLILNHKKNMIKSYFNDIEKSYTIEYLDEDKPLGTGGGLSLLKGKINTSFFLTNCDILIDEDYEKIYNFHLEENNLITIVCSLKNIKIPYGVIEISEKGDIEFMKEKPELTFFTNTGMYIVEPRIINELEKNQTIGFPEIIEQYRVKGEKIGIYPISDNSWLDMGQIDEMEEMRKRLQKDE